MSELIAPEDDISRGYLVRREKAQTMDAIERARQKVGQQTHEAPPEPRVEDEGPSAVRKTAADIGKGVFVESPRAMAAGLVDAATEFTENVMQLTDPLAQYLESNIPLGEAPSPEELFGVVRPEDPETITAGFIKGATQFAAGFIPALKATRLLGLGQKAGAAGKVAEAVVAGTLADVAVFDEAEGRLSNLIQEVPALKNPITEFLAADPDDTVAEGKLKQALEGAGLGGVPAIFVEGLRYIRAARAGKPATPAGASKETAKTDIAQASKTGEAATTAEAELSKLGDRAAPMLSIDDSLRQQARNFAEGKPVDFPEDRVGNINLSRIGGPEDVRNLIGRTAMLFEDLVEGPVQSNRETILLANEIAADPDRMLEVLSRGEGAFTAAEVTSLRFLLQQSGVELKHMAAKAAGVGATEVDKFAFERQLAFHGALLEQTSKSAREAGRALQAYNIAAEGTVEQERAIRELLNQTGVDAGTKAQMIAALDTPEGLHTFVKQARKAKTADMLLEAWINGLLSGPQTHAVNMLSNAMVATWMIPERMLAAGIRRLTGGDGVAQGEAVSQAYGLLRGFQDGLVLFAKAMRTGEPSDAFAKIEARQYRAITGQNFGLEESSLWGRAIDLLGEGVRLPGRFLSAEDEFFKSIGYRMELNAQAHRQAASEGLEGAAASSRIQEIINNPPENIRLAAIDAARIQTFTNPLGQRGARFQTVVNATPPLKLIMPFIRTPLNIMKFIGVRSPLAPLAQQRAGRYRGRRCAQGSGPG